jgi:hypothetical protein
MKNMITVNDRDTGRITRLFCSHRRGSTLVVVLILMSILTLTGLALLKVSEGRLVETVRIKSLESASAAAEAGYEKAVFWMSQQVDMLEALETANQTVSLSFPQSSADYKISFVNFVGSRPVFKLEANGYHGIYQKTLSAYLVQAVAGWEMGKCRIVSDTTQTAQVRFVNGEIIAMPLHINDLKDNPDSADIYISGSPNFMEHVSMGESRHTSGGKDKYASLLKLFPEGISFNQPASRIVDPTTISVKNQRFFDATNPAYRLTPKTVHTLPKDSKGKTGFYNTVSAQPAVQLKFYVKDGQGFVRIINDCTVAGYTRAGSSTSTWDYKVDPANPATKYIKYPIYGCHYSNAAYTDVRIDDSSAPIYVSQNFNGIKSDPGAQIHITGNVVIGCSSEDAATLGTLNTVKGRISIVATGAIWIANELKIDGVKQADGMPDKDNPNVIGLISESVIKVVDPGMTTNNLLYNKSYYNATKLSGYNPIGVKDGSTSYSRVLPGTVTVEAAMTVGVKDGSTSYSRVLPGTVTVEAAMTVGGGGWGAENVYRSSSYAGRKNFSSSSNDKLIIRGTLTEAIRGIVGNGDNGYIKQYYYDQRLTTGILPSNIWLKGKYILVPGGWNESSTVKSE